MLSLPNALLRRLTTFLGALLVLHAPALATWSIVVLNHKTGEVCVATATCIPNFQIRRYVPVVRVGLGGAAAQSWVDSQACPEGTTCAGGGTTATRLVQLHDAWPVSRSGTSRAGPCLR